MATENVFTDVDRTLKELFETVDLDGSPVPVRIVTPDPDIVELVTPCITLQLVDLRRDPRRVDNDRTVEKDLDEMTADVRPPPAPYNLHYTVTAHGSTSREDRILLGEVVLAVEENPEITSSTMDRTFRLGRDVSFRESSKARDFARGVGIAVKTWLEPRQVEEVPLVEKTVFHVLEITHS